MKKINLSKLSNKIKYNDKGEARKTKDIIIAAILIALIAIVSLILVFALYIIIASPDFDKDKLYSKESTIIYYKDGVTELSRIGFENRTLVTYDDLPQVLVDAIIATEDSRFFQHKGLDVARFIKASFGQLLGRKSSGGASTLTMQVVKKTYTNEEDTSGLDGIIRKFTDIYMSVFKVESNYTKEEILEFYVNSLWFAGNGGNVNYTGVAGVEEASQYFFGKSVSDLTLAEASIIAGMFQNPSTRNPYLYPENTRARQKTVLTLMVNHGYITEEEKEAVLAIPIESLLVNKKEVKTTTYNQAVIDYVRNDVKAATGYDPFYTPMKIVTTIDPKVQDVLNKLEKDELYEFPNEDMLEGMAITSTIDGSIVALSGGRNYTAHAINWATQRHQPGSTAKILFDYGPYIEYLNGSPSTLFLDEETTYTNGTSIKNADGTYMGLITMRTALVNSRNIPALRAFKAVFKENPNYIIDFVHSLGIDYGAELYESASIGGFEGISPIELSAAYAAFGRGGYYIKPYIYTKVTLTETGEEFTYKYDKVKVMREETAYMITDMLMSAAEAGVGGVKVSGTTIAAKSGTTNVDRKTAEDKGIPTSANRDAWNVTYSPEYSIALWLGYEKIDKEHYLTTAIGNRVRNAVMNAVGSRVYSKDKTFTKPSGIISMEIEAETIPVQLPSSYTPADLRRTDLFRDGTEPTDVSTRFTGLANPTNGKYTYDGTELKLSWTGIATPDAINTNYLQDYFNKNFDTSATKYYEQRIAYNNNYVGTLGYNIYQKDASGILTDIGRVEETNYTIKNPLPNVVAYIIKSSYSIFTANQSSGLEIKVNPIVDSNVTDLVDIPNTDSNDDDQSNDGLE